MTSLKTHILIRLFIEFCNFVNSSTWCNSWVKVAARNFGIAGLQIWLIVTFYFYVVGIYEHRLESTIYTISRRCKYRFDSKKTL